MHYSSWAPNFPGIIFRPAILNTLIKDDTLLQPMSHIVSYQCNYVKTFKQIAQEDPSLLYYYGGLGEKVSRSLQRHFGFRR